MTRPLIPRFVSLLFIHYYFLLSLVIFIYSLTPIIIYYYSRFMCSCCCYFLGGGALTLSYKCDKWDWNSIFLLTNKRPSSFLNYTYCSANLRRTSLRTARRATGT